MNISLSNDILSRILINYFSKKIYSPGPIFTVVMLIISALMFLNDIKDLSQYKLMSHDYLPSSCKITQVIPDTNTTEQANQSTLRISLGSSQNHERILCPKVLARYLVGNQYRDAEITIGCIFGQQQENNLLAAYAVGQIHDCWYDPNNITQVSFGLDKKSQTTPFVWMAISLFIATWIGYHYLFPKTNIKPIQNCNPTHISSKHNNHSREYNQYAN